MNSRKFVCIVCPNGCEIEAEFEGENIKRISGNKCRKGEEYVVQELIDPRRTIASSVRIEGSFLPLCSVRLTNPIPKKDIFRVMEEVNKIHLKAPVHVGDIVLHNVCGLGSDVVVTKNMERV